MATVKYSGPIASFRCPTNADIRSLKVHFSPKQEGSGDPSPENVRPIVGWSNIYLMHHKKNAFDTNMEIGEQDNSSSPKRAPLFKWILGGWLNDIAYYAPNNIISFRKTATGIAFTSNDLRYGVYFVMPVIPQTKIRLDYDCVDNVSMRFCWLTREWKYITMSGSQASKITVPDNAFFAKISFGGKTTGQEIEYSNIRISIESDAFSGSMLMPYEPYHGETIDYEFGVLGKNKFPASNGTTSDIFLAANTAYTFSATSPSAGYFKGWYEDETDTGLIWINAGADENRRWKTYTPKKNIIKGLFYVGTGMSECQIELGSTATAYEPYDPNHTVYGGWVDLISGEVCEEWKPFDLTELTLTQFGAGESVLTISAFPGAIKSRNAMYCNFLPPVSNPNISGVEGVDWNNSRMNMCLSVNRGLDTQAEVEQWLADMKTEGTTPTIVADMVTPNTYHLAPTQLQTFLGQNNVWSNADYVEVEYDLHETQDILKRKQFIIANQPHIEQISDTLAHFKTDISAPLKECKIHFSPKQEGEGDPSPENIRAITGWTGVMIGINGKNFCTAATGTEVVEKWPYSLSNSSRNISFRNMPPEQDFVLSGYFNRTWETSANRRVYLYGLRTGGSFFGPPQDGPARKSITNKPNANGVLTVSLNNRGLTYDGIDGPAYAASLQQLQLELGTTPTDYEPYQGQTLTLDWTDEVGTIYGGYVDLVKGEIVQTWISRLGPEMDVQTSSSTDEPWVHRFSLRGPWISAIGYENAPAQFEWDSDKIPHGNAKENVSGLSGSGVLYVYDNTISTIQSFKEKYADTQFVYQIRPAAYKHYAIDNLTIKTLKGINNIWSNSNGPIELSYWTH